MVRMHAGGGAVLKLGYAKIQRTIKDLLVK